MGLPAAHGSPPQGGWPLLTAEDGHVHFRWDRTLPPVVEITPGDRLVIETRTGEDNQLRPGDGPEAVDRLDFARLHALTGPVAIRGAKPGDLLAVVVEAVEVADVGFLLERPGAGLLRGFPTYLRHVALDATAGVARFAPGIDIPLAPFLGIMGVAPAGPPVRTIEPGPHGGNLDCRDLGVGATLYLPVQVPGALFSCGDAHAAQGDGEVCVTGIETSVRARLRFELLRPAIELTGPVAETADTWMTLSAAATLEEAARQATADMIALIVGATGLTPGDAYALASAAVDVRINQVVNGDRFGVRAVMPKAVLPLPDLGARRPVVA